MLEKIQNLIDEGSYNEAAKLFLEETNTELSISYDRFDSIKWDADGQKRNIFKISLNTPKGKFHTEYGAPVVESCKEVTKIESGQDFELYTGYSMRRKSLTGRISDRGKKVYIGTKFKINAKYIKSGEMPEGLSEKIQEAFDEKIEEFLNTTVWQYKSLKQEAKRKMRVPAAKLLRSKMNSAKEDFQKETVFINEQGQIIEPDAYDILSCFSVSYFENVDEVWETFGNMKPSQANAIFEQDKQLTALFSEDEIEMLNAIS